MSPVTEVVQEVQLWLRLEELEPIPMRGHLQAEQVQPLLHSALERILAQSVLQWVVQLHNLLQSLNRPPSPQHNPK